MRNFLSSGSLRRGRVGIVCMLPAVIVLSVTALWPLVRVLFLSFTNQELFGASEG